MSVFHFLRNLAVFGATAKTNSLAKARLLLSIFSSSIRIALPSVAGAKHEEARIQRSREKSK